jgi:hypothetical protein
MRKRQLLLLITLSYGCSETESGASQKADQLSQEVGPQGEEGPVGEMGQKGETGAEGHVGAEGRVGATGARGEAGPAGDRGETGVEGQTGPRGDRGPAGSPGPAGSSGPAGSAGPAGAAGPAGVGLDALPTQFVGLSGEAVGCGDGIRPLQLACNQSFPGSRPCTSAEYINTVAPPQHDALAWILPKIVDFAARSDGNLYALDISGIVAHPRDFTCQGWQGIGTHLGLSPNGAFVANLSPEDTHPVACCRVNE